MRKINFISEKRQAAIDALKNSEIAVGEKLYVKTADFYGKGYPRAGELIAVNVAEISTDKTKLLLKNSKISTAWVDAKLVHRNIRDIGANPFNIRDIDCRSVAFSLESILSNLNILSEETDEKFQFHINGMLIGHLNWNPFVYDKEGNKVNYQRGFVWTIQDKQLLIESIYSGIDCGRILVRKRGYDELQDLADKGETDMFFHDIVDGKQRLDAVRGFVLGEFPDMHGNYFGDLSAYAQHKFTDNQVFSYVEMPENSKDEDVIYQFLRMNFSGVQMSKEHLDYVKSINI